MSYDDKLSDYRIISEKLDKEEKLKSDLIGSFKGWISRYKNEGNSGNTVILKTIIDIYFIVYDNESIKSTLSSEIYELLLSDIDILNIDSDKYNEIVESIDDSISIIDNLYSNASNVLEGIFKYNWYPFVFNTSENQSDSMELHKAILKVVHESQGRKGNIDQVINSVILPIFKGEINSFMDEKQIIKYMLSRAGGDKSKGIFEKTTFVDKKTPNQWQNQDLFNSSDMNKYHLNTNTVVENCDTKLHVLPELGTGNSTSVKKLEKYNKSGIMFSNAISNINDIRDLIEGSGTGRRSNLNLSGISKYLENIMNIQESLAENTDKSKEYYRISLNTWVSQPKEPRDSERTLRKSKHKTDLDSILSADNISLYKSVSLNFDKEINPIDVGVLDFSKPEQLIAMVLSRRIMNSLIVLHDSYDKMSLNTMGLFSPYNGSTLRAWSKKQSSYIPDSKDTLKAEWVPDVAKVKNKRYLKWKYLSSHFRRIVRISHKLNKEICKDSKKLDAITGEDNHTRKRQKIRTKKGGGSRPVSRKHQYHEKKIQSGYWKRAFRKIGWGLTSLITRPLTLGQWSAFNYMSSDKKALRDPKEERQIEISDIEYTINLPDFQAILSPSYPTISPLILSENNWKFGIQKKNKGLFTNSSKNEKLEQVLQNSRIYKHSDSETSLKNRYVITDTPAILKYPVWFNPDLEIQLVPNGPLYNPGPNWDFGNINGDINFARWIVRQWTETFPSDIKKYFTDNYKLKNPTRYDNYIKNLAKFIITTYGLMNTKNNNDLLNIWFNSEGSETKLSEIMNKKSEKNICGNSYK